MHGKQPQDNPFLLHAGCAGPARPSPTKKVHFSAYLSGAKTYNRGNVVKFNDIQLNHGNAYNSSSGVFSCPKSGVYQVTWFFVNNNSKGHAWLQLEINEKTYAYAGQRLDGVHTSAFRSLLVRLKRGDQVRVVAYSNNMAVNGNDRHTGFSALYVSA